MSFFQRHLLTGLGLFIGPLISIGALIIHAYALIEMGFPASIWVAIGLAIFFSSVIGIVFQQHKFITAPLHQNSVASSASPTKAPPIAEQSARQELPIIRENRQYVEISTMSLRGYYGEGRTMAEGRRLTSPYMNKWIRLTDKVKNVSVSDNGGLVWTDQHQALLIFGKEWNDQIEILRIGAIVEVEGRITGVSSLQVELSDCGLIT